MAFKLNRNKKHDPPATAVVQEPVVEQEVIATQEMGSEEDVVGQSAADPTTPMMTISDTSASDVVDTTQNSDVSVSAEESEPTVPTAEAVVEQEITSRGEEMVHTEPPLIETCEAAVVGPVSAIAAAAAPSTALAVVKQEGTAVVKKPIISERMRKTWGRSVKGDKANILLPGVHPDFAGDLVITKLVDNPKLPGKGPWLRFAKYRNGMTVDEYVKACERLTTAKVSQADLKWDVNHGYIRVSVAAEEETPKVVEQAA